MSFKEVAKILGKVFGVGKSHEEGMWFTEVNAMVL